MLNSSSLLFCLLVFSNENFPSCLPPILATEAVNTCYITSTYSTCSVEEISAAAPNGYRWFQLYVYRDRKLSEQIVHRVEALGYKALVLTVDVPYTGKRRDDIRNQFKLPPHLKVKNFEGIFQVIMHHFCHAVCEGGFMLAHIWMCTVILK